MNKKKLIPKIAVMMNHRKEGMAVLHTVIVMTDIIRAVPKRRTTEMTEEDISLKGAFTYLNTI